ncbi:MAG: TlpA family protein disulfide reductase [Polyangiaceae bacterium]|nr:TlpA family protein disulfide reductase [Polyangiaceae bacterium]
MLALKGRFEARGLRVVSVTEVDKDDMAEEKPLVQKAAEEEKMTYPCYLDEDGAWQKGAGIDGIPTFLVVSRDGKIVHRVRGKLEEGSGPYQAMAGAVDAALAAK